ncbi:DUF4917 family protein [Solimonas terrae]|uniref:DUF4917 family protein n=1 Tax=Solimonas terrae TaxID=1396819 RepID=A0A6M2BRT3_9GAMM|nr:DUF4917 family protein [Solimonas terrae]NGY04739.1 DUF4917 family protein [Solimonas terrae]
MDLETFDDVRASIRKNPSRSFHLLLGNGFSMAYDPSIFSYNALHDFVEKLNDKDLSVALSVIETRNFEVIMQYLDTCSALISAFGGDSSLKKKIDQASAKLKKSLLRAVKELHPEHVFKVPEAQSKACSNFLSVFLNAGGNIYSTNYDLLLYWVLLRNNVVNHVDGCGRELENVGDEFVPEEEQVWSDLVWGKHRKDQNVFYLHGALQFFDNGTAITKEEYDEYNYLLQKIGARMESGEYPIFVTAGDGRQKLKHIMHNHYLTHCYESLCEAQGSLVTFGFNFGQYDDHIISAINKAARKGRSPSEKLWSVYIGVYSESDRAHIEKIRGKFKCKVRIYDAKSVDVWGRRET